MERSNNERADRRSELCDVESALESTKAELKAAIGRCRDEELLQSDLTSKQASLTVEVEKLVEQETHLKGHSDHLESLKAQSKERLNLLNEEKKSV